MKEGDYVFLVDWFSKGTHKVDNIKEKIDDLFQSLKECGKNKTSMREVADCVEKTLRTSKAALYVVSDTRLPTSSLYHHMKNTAGIAIPLLLEEDDGYWRHPDKIAHVRISALLHDIGKFVAQGKGKAHVEKGKDILEDILSEWSIDEKTKKAIVDNAIRHHNNKYYDPFLPLVKVQRIISKADSAASGADRRYEIVYYEDTGQLKNEDHIFPHRVELGGEKYFIPPQGYKDVGEISGYEEGYGRKYVLLNDETVKGGFIDTSEWEFKLDGKISLLRMDISGIQNFISSVKSLDTMRGASAIIEEAGKRAEDVISQMVSKESVVYKGGGNLIAFVPPRKAEEIRSEVEKEVEKILMWPESGTRPIVVTEEFSLKEISSDFNKCIEKLVKKSDMKKSEPLHGLSKLSIRSDELCEECSERKAETSVGEKNMCPVCAKKIKKGREKKFSMEGTEELYLGYERPRTTEEISGIFDEDKTSTGNIAVIQMDGNRMGVLFRKTRTPAEYSLKSTEFDSRMKKAIKEAIEEVHQNNKSKDKRYIKGRREFWLDILYIGGDDIVILSDARYAVRLADTIAKKVEKEFRCELEYYNSPTVTVSGGIAIAKHDFPIYFLFDAARRAEHKAKEEFRKNINKEKDRPLLPAGSISISVVDTTMPSDRFYTYLIGDREIEEIMKIVDISNEYLEKEEEKNRKKFTEQLKSTFQEILSAPEDGVSLFNLRKFYYSNYNSKEGLKRLLMGDYLKGEFGIETGAELVEFLSKYMKQGENRREALKAMFPMVVV